MNSAFLYRQQFTQSLRRIPKKNKPKFQADLLKLIELAQKDNYENFDLENH